jgi:hypothetical protein
VTVAFFGYKNNLASIKVFMEVLICISVFVLEFASIKAGDYQSKFSKELRVYFFQWAGCNQGGSK